MVQAGHAPDFTPLFIIGAPRSGTTWIQQMLGSHRNICAPPEMGLIHTYLSVWKQRWDREVEDAGRPDSRSRGLPAVVPPTEFVRLMRSAAIAVYDVARRGKPGAQVLLDKEPTNTFHVPLIAEIFPEARLIHLLRDGRDVAASLVAAHSGWARDWAPGNVADAARVWKDHVLAARSGRERGLPFKEVRYEWLLASPEETLLDLLDFVGVEADPETVSSIVRSSAFDRLKASGAEPPGFYRRGTVGSWASEWGASDRSRFDRVAGRLLLDLEYEKDGSWSYPTAGARAAAMTDVVAHSLKEQIKRPLGRWIARHPSLGSR